MEAEVETCFPATEEDWLLEGLLDSSAPRVYISTLRSDSLSTRLTHAIWKTAHSGYRQWRLRGQCPSLQHSGQTFSLSWQRHSLAGDGQWMTETMAKSGTGCLLMSCHPPPLPLQIKKAIQCQMCIGGTKADLGNNLLSQRFLCGSQFFMVLPMAHQFLPISSFRRFHVFMFHFHLWQHSP